jgi:hypothetical protein
MFGWFKKKSESEYSDYNLLRKYLFPQLIVNERNGTKFHIDYSVDANLEAVLSDIEDGQIDEATMASLKYALEQIQKTRLAFGFKKIWHKDVSYIVIGNKYNDISTTIIPKELT